MNRFKSYLIVRIFATRNEDNNAPVYYIDPEIPFVRITVN